MTGTITALHAREILDSRGNPTIEVECTLESGLMARAAVPSGASTGEREAVELRDGDAARFNGKGVQKALAAIHEQIAPVVIGQQITEQAAIDAMMIAVDGTPNKAKLGANAILGVSQAVARAAALHCGLPLFRYLGGAAVGRLPVPHMNIMNGGVHAHWQGADFQEFMIAPFGAPNFHEAVRWGSEIYQALRSVLEHKHMSVGVGDEGGFAPMVSSNEEPLALIVQAIEQVGLHPGIDVGIAIDPASSEFFKDGRYQLRTEKRSLDATEIVEYYRRLVANFPIVLLEDGMAENDWEGWKQLNAALGAELELVGDDIFCTNPVIIQQGIDQKIANSVLIKLNQIGSVSETLAATRLAQHHGWGAFVSHRSGETVDSFIADLTIALDTGHLKTGAPARGERVEKYNQLMRIEESLGQQARYAGPGAYVRPPRG